MRGAFDGAVRLANITADSQNQRFSDVQGVLYNKDQTGLIHYPRGRVIATIFTVPNGVEWIGDRAFYGNNRISNVVLPQTTTIIGDETFSGSSLVRINLDNVQEIGNSAFKDSGLRGNINLPRAFVIHQGAFENTNITRVLEIGQGVHSSQQIFLHSRAFYGTMLTSFRIPSNVQALGNEVFAETNITNIVIPSSVAYMGERVFAASFLENMIFERSIAEHGSATVISGTRRENALAGAENLSKIYIMDEETKQAYDDANFALYPFEDIVFVNRSMILFDRYLSFNDREYFDSPLPAGEVIGKTLFVSGYNIESPQISVDGFFVLDEVLGGTVLTRISLGFCNLGIEQRLVIGIGINQNTNQGYISVSYAASVPVLILSVRLVL